jgi:hypothetical protein
MEEREVMIRRVMAAAIGIAVLMALVVVSPAGRGGMLVTAHAAGRTRPAVGAHQSTSDPRFGEIDVFWRGTDANLWEAYRSSGGWSANPLKIGMGPLGSDPTVAVQSNGEEDVFWKGTNGDLWEAWFDGRWHGPLEIHMGTLGSAPTAVAHGSVQDVFWKGTDGDLWEAYYNGAWHGPGKLGMGTLGSAPSATATDSGYVAVAWKGTNGRLWTTHYLGSWTGPDEDPASGTLLSGPGIAIDPRDGVEMDAFWEGGDGNLWRAVNADLEDAPAVKIGFGTLGSAPSAFRRNIGDQDVFWEGTDGNLWQAFYSAISHSWTLRNLGYGPLS